MGRACPRVIGFSNPEDRRGTAVFYERRLGSLGEIIKEAEIMDADSGIRVVGSYDGRPCYAFVTRFGKNYTLMVYGRQGGKGGRLGRRLAATELQGIDELTAALRKIVSARAEAYTY
jgi:hypothetical protein